VLDWDTRRVLAWWVSITLEADFCIEAVEEVDLRAYASVSEARASIGRYLGFYNSRRPHSSLGGKTPDQAYFNALVPVPVAASSRRQPTYEMPGTCSNQPNRLFELALLLIESSVTNQTDSRPK